MNKNYKRDNPKLFKPIKQKRIKSKYSKIELYEMFVARKIVVPGPMQNKKKYNKKHERQKRYY